MEVALALLIVLGLYFLPFIIALMRSHKQTAAIFVLNLFLGWTLIGWVVSLAMAVSSSGETHTVVVNTSGAAVPGYQVTPATDGAPRASVVVPTLAEAATHDHEWVDSEASHGGAGVVVQTRRCTVCGLIEAKPAEKHEHTWGDPLPSGKFKDRLYQECAGCKAARYIN